MIEISSTKNDGELDLEQSLVAHFSLFLFVETGSKLTDGPSRSCTCLPNLDHIWAVSGVTIFLLMT